MRRNANKSKGQTNGGVFAYSKIISGAGNKKVNRLNSLIGTFPRSPPSEIKNAEGGACPDDFAPSTVASSESGNSIRETTPADQSAVVIPYESNELLGRIDTKSINTKSALSPVKEDCSAKSTTKSIETPVEEDTGGGGGWVGIGFDGEAMALSVCSRSSSVGPSSVHDRPIPKAIDVKRFESDNLPVVEEDKISTANDDKFLKTRSLAKRVSLDVEELSVDLNVLDDLDSVTSVMTKEDAMELAKRLEMMEHQLLQLAGEPGKLDAIRALARAAHNQTRKSESLQRKVRSQEKKISTLNDLCQRLMERKRQDKSLRSATQKAIDELKDSKFELTLELRRSESRNEETTPNQGETSQRIRRLEEENAEKSRLLSQSDSEKTQMRAKFDELRDESRRRAEEDKAAMKKLESEMTEMSVAHARDEKRSKSKIQILTQIKSAMEEQIRFLEGNDSSTE